MITNLYTGTHQAFESTARRFDLRPHDIRVLVALHDRGELSDTARIELDLRSTPNAVRRSLLALDGAGMVERDRKEVRMKPAGRNTVGYFIDVRKVLTDRRVAA